jgi:chromosome segregation protein
VPKPSAQLLDAKLDALREAARRHAEQVEAALAEVSEAEAHQGRARGSGAVRSRLSDTRVTVDAARMTMLARRGEHDELKREGELRERRLVTIADELNTWKNRLASAETQLTTCRGASRSGRGAGDRAHPPAEIEARRSTLGQSIPMPKRAVLRPPMRSPAPNAPNAEAVAGERAAERAASEAREARAAAEARRDAASEAVDAAAARISEELETTPKRYAREPRRSARPPAARRPHRGRCPPPAPSTRRAGRGEPARRGRRQIRAGGARHPSAPRKRTSRPRSPSCAAGSRRSTRKGAPPAAAFEQVNTNFSKLFTHLFGGGEARLVLVESDDPLEAGLEILCQPPGKKLSTLSLLSGGEQTLTALALIFAVFLANPAPICVLDEVDAPLDDANVGRFCDLLDEMTAGPRRGS